MARKTIAEQLIEQIKKGEVNSKNIDYNSNSVANQLINQIKNNNVDVSKINIEKTTDTSTKKNKSSLWNDILGIAKNTGIGGKIGIEQMLKKTELDMENSNSSYKNRVQNQFLSSNKISDTVKAEVKNNNILANKVKINANLPTISNVIGKTNKEEQEKLENKVQNEIKQYRNAEGKIETNLTKQRLQNAIDEDNKKIAENTNNMSNDVTKYIASNLAPSIGQMGTGAIMSAINPAYGVLYFTQSAGGSYYDDAKQRGMSEDEALKYGTIMGVVEGATELIGLKQFSKAGKTVKTLIKGTGKEVLEEGLEKTSKVTLKTALKEYGIGIADNIMQESIIEPIQELTSQVVAGKDKANWDNIGQRMLQSGINGGLVSAIVGGSNLGIQSCTAIVEKANKGQIITEQEFKQAVNDASKKLDVPKMIVDNTQQQINKYKNNTSNLQQSTQTQQILPTQQISQEQNKVAQNGNMEKNIANNQEALYNNSNESESGIDGREQTTEIIRKNEQGRVKGLLPTNRGRQENDTGYQTNNEGQKEIEYIRNVDNHIKDLDSNQIRIVDRYQSIGIPVKFYTFNSRTGGRYDNGILHINTYNMTEEQQANVATHEYAHHLLRNNTNFQNEISPIADKIIASENEERTEAIRNYIMDRDENITIDDLKKVQEIALEEILADYVIDIDNNVDFNQYNQYGIDIDLLNEYKTIVQKYLPKKLLNTNTEVNINNLKNNNKVQSNKMLNPTEIANLTMQDANTTPTLQNKNYQKGNKESSFFSNIVTDAKFLNKDLRQEMAHDENIRYYKGITNAETLEKAYTELQNGGQQETLQWFNKDTKNVSAEDVAKGWILLKQYQDSGDYQGAVEVAKKMRNMGTNVGQAVQAYNILSRLTPEGMFYYAQSELSEAYNKMAEGKTKKWIEENRNKFDLTPEETQLIKEKMESIQGIDDERTKKIALGEIQKIISNKIPATASQSLKSWMRISMLFNPKTQVRNISGNAVILPVNMTSDFIASGIDKAISKKTGVRTTGNTNIKKYAKGFGKGLYESYDDFRKGVNTRNIEGNRFEVKEGKNFKDKGIGKVLNRVDNLLSFMLDAGDRGFYEATFTNSINNQLVLNNATEVTQDMVDIATNEALQRTWQDNNAYTQTVLTIRNALNGKVGKNKGMGYGLGDVLIPFAKTPANLTKAIIDYSPVGLTKTLAIDARKFKNSLENGQYTPQLQHKLVQNLGKGMAGTFLYVLGYALAKAGIVSGEADDDKDVKNFMKNSLGISSYSIKIGDKTFTYDWAQPVATPLAIMTNYVKYSKDNPDANALEKIWNSMNIGTEQLLQQSFMESLNTVLNGSGSTMENLSQAVLELPSRAIPTFSKQITDLVDGTQRTSFEYKKPIESSINSIKAKIPGLSQTLAPAVDTLGNEIQKYGGDNNVWNVMFNPANTNKGQLSKAGEEIYNVYMQTGDTTIFPRTAPYYIDSKGERTTMTSSQRSEFQKVTGKYVESTLNGLLDNKDYKKLSDEKKVELINEIVSDSYAKAKYDILKIDSEEYKKLRNTLKDVKTTSYYDYKFKTDKMKKDSDKIEVIVDANYTNNEKTVLYENYIKSDTDVKYDIIKSTGLNINSYLKYKLADSKDEFTSDKKDDGTVKGKTITNSSKNKRYNYINSIQGATYTQKLVLFALEYEPSSNTDKQQIVNYVKSLKGKTNKEKLEIMSKFKGVTIYKNGTFKY